MKKLWLAGFTLLLFHCSNAQQEVFNRLIGKWDITTQDNENAVLDIVDSANIFLIYDGKRKKCMDPTIDFSKTPHWFDFSTTDGDSSIQIRTIVEIFNDDVIRWQLFLDEDRSPHFTASKGEIMYLRKTKPSIITAVANH